jgi:hypothetical protein
VTAIRTERAFPIRGIREDLPAGERVLWQGAPDWRDLAITAFHVRKVALYFAALLALRCTLLLADGLTLGAALRGTLPMALLAGTGVLLLVGISFWSARSTIYAITTARVVMRVGMALPIDINLPFTGIEQARLAQRKSGHGDLPMTLQGDVRLAYAHLWPYARPWKLTHPEPMMRAVPRAAEVAQLLGEALATSGGTALMAAPVAVQSTPAGHRGVASPVMT